MGIAFERIIVVMFENATRDTVLKNGYMNHLRQKGVFLKNSFGVTHPSQPNYIALIGGDTFGFNSDNPNWATVFGTNNSPTSIVDLIEAKRHVTWKAYAEALEASDIVPSTTPPGKITAGHGCFVRRHVPFLSYGSIVDNPERAKKIVNAEDFFINDWQHGILPHFSFYTPGLINDGHSTICDGGVSRIAADDGQNLANIETFLRSFLGDDSLQKYPPETLIVLTFDEAYPYDANYNIYTLLIGDMLEAGMTRTEPYNHYSLLRSIEENFHLGTLERSDAAATPYWFLTGCC
jgi:hypothetical protein